MVGDDDVRWVVGDDDVRWVVGDDDASHNCVNSSNLTEPSDLFKFFLRFRILWPAVNLGPPKILQSNFGANPTTQMVKKEKKLIERLCSGTQHESKGEICAKAFQ